MKSQRSQPSYRNPSGSAEHHPAPGTLFLVGSPIGSPDDLTIRAIEVLKRVSVIAAETPLAVQALLAHHGISARVTSYSPRNCKEKIAVLLHYLRQGQDIALLSDSGMPVIFDPGRLLILAARKAGCPVTAIPGPSALTTAVALSGFVGDRIVFEGQLPRTKRLWDDFFTQFQEELRTMVFFVSSRSLSSILRSLARIIPRRPVTLAVNMTRTNERFYQGRPAQLLKQVCSHLHDTEITMVIAGKPRTRRAKKRARSELKITHRLGAG